MTRGVPSTLHRLLVALLVLGAVACDRPATEQSAADAVADSPCRREGLGLLVPEGFCTELVAEYFPGARHLLVHENGDMFLSSRNRQLGGAGGVYVISGPEADGREVEVQTFGDAGGVGLKVRGDYLYFGRDDAIVRYRLSDDPGAVPPGPAELVVSGLPRSQYHAAKAFAFDDAGDLLVNIGAPSNACQAVDRTVGSAGQDPCPELASAGGVWRFPAGAVGLRFPVDGERYASGIRHMLALAWHPGLQVLIGVQHGRDHLHDFWPGQFTAQQQATMPAEELLLIRPASTFGWPYCFLDPTSQRYLLAPEYGGAGEADARCDAFDRATLGFPAHHSPNDLLVYQGDAFPARYASGLFVAFHGGYRGDAATPSGQQVAFVPLVNGELGPDWESFATPEPGTSYRPTGLAVDPDGALLVVDSTAGRIWRVRFERADASASR